MMIGVSFPGKRHRGPSSTPCRSLCHCSCDWNLGVAFGLKNGLVQNGDYQSSMRGIINDGELKSSLDTSWLSIRMGWFRTLMICLFLLSMRGTQCGFCRDYIYIYIHGDLIGEHGDTHKEKVMFTKRKSWFLARTQQPWPIGLSGAIAIWMMETYGNIHRKLVPFCDVNRWFMKPLETSWIHLALKKKHTLW